MNILGIDTSCDDTSAGIIADGRLVLSNVVHSQIRIHSPYGGVVPELASREHLRNIMPVVREALLRAHLEFPDLDAVSVTVGPGLVGSLLVGLYYAKAIAYTHGIPMIGVNHLEGHILSIFLEETSPSFPFIALTVSGGHTSLYHVTGYGQYTQLGQTLDDAAGEAFDKVSKILGLGYPGGVAIERQALSGCKDRINFPRVYLSNDSLNFSFSGLKTAVALYIKKWREDGIENNNITQADIAASFQESVVDVLVRKVMMARDKTGISTIVIAGGVACNRALRERLFREAEAHDLRVYIPSPQYCTDNGAMIALAGYQRYLAGEFADLATDVRSKYPIKDLPLIEAC
ncbi:tRNA N6-adenosine threonylcarbamoyltransferase [uncultured Desulfobacterium sp.]|uniref:tRNA N6-adenosine threonylcarbamoyltransferase n=1 Tax=uncultured Desulfobacterium sp. TaxID=201089 RepID=A0A445N2L3_9BACT|nr:tRNA N6-adenosine threonylcarbamoyltransferase [uncultured Desulfobacterium sp.]